MINCYGPYWDNATAVFYVFLAMVGAFCIKHENTSVPIVKKKVRLYPYYTIWWIVWVVAASLRTINQYKIGGTDAWSYINFFQDIYDWEGKMITYDHYETGWKILMRLLRIFIDNYRSFLIIYHGFLVYSYVYFLNNFRIDKYYQAPFVLLFFIYLRGFTSFRTNASVGLILIMLVLLHKNKFWKAVIFGVLAVSLQISSAMYLLIIPFWYLYKNNKLRPKIIIILVTVSSAIAVIARSLILGPLGRMLGHSYASYVSHNVGTSFLDNYWKIAIGQLFVAVLLLLFNKQFLNRISNNDECAENIKDLRLICVFDIITIPITFILDIWRGYEYLYIVRLLLYSETMYFISSKMKKGGLNTLFAITCYGVCIAWLLFRIMSTYETSGYVPYIPFFSSTI